MKIDAEDIQMIYYTAAANLVASYKGAKLFSQTEMVDGQIANRYAFTFNNGGFHQRLDILNLVATGYRIVLLVQSNEGETDTISMERFFHSFRIQ